MACRKISIQESPLFHTHDARSNVKRQRRTLHDYEAASGLCLACNVCPQPSTPAGAVLTNKIIVIKARGKGKVVVKSVRHFRLQNERDILRRFQNKTPYIRPLLDEIEDPPTPAIILRHLDDDLLDASNSQRLTCPEIKYVAKRVLQALAALHSEGFIHTGVCANILDLMPKNSYQEVDVKPSNVLVNYNQDGARFWGCSASRLREHSSHGLWSRSRWRPNRNTYFQKP
jgi:serine/threonine protein kinase